MLYAFFLGYLMESYVTNAQPNRMIINDTGALQKLIREPNSMCPVKISGDFVETPVPRSHPPQLKVSTQHYVEGGGKKIALELF